MRIQAAAVCCFLLAGQAHAQGGAEYAFRWYADEGGPKRLADVFEALELEPKKLETYPRVTYYTVAASMPKPKQIPEDARIIVRERGVGDADTMWKYRSATPIAEPDSLKCPLQKAHKSKYEKDVSLVAPGDARASYAWSCTGKGTVDQLVPAAAAATQSGCPSSMERRDAKGKHDITVEEWTLANARVAIEVSLTGLADPSPSSEFFDKVVQRLIERGVRPLATSMTDLGTTC